MLIRKESLCVSFVFFNLSSFIQKKLMTQAINVQDQLDRLRQSLSNTRPEMPNVACQPGVSNFGTTPPVVQSSLSVNSPLSIIKKYGMYVALLAIVGVLVFIFIKRRNAKKKKQNEVKPPPLIDSPPMNHITPDSPVVPNASTQPVDPNWTPLN
jgi:hypothetical protein